MRIGVFCSGGDAPGMNACVRAVVRTASSLGHEVAGILRGYQGLIDREFHKQPDGTKLLSVRCVSDWSRHGGAFLFSSRSDEFMTRGGRLKAIDCLKDEKIDALIPVGGDGTFTGALALAEDWSGQIIGCPGTIDNDLQGSDYTIGFATAVQTAVEALDKIRDTAQSHDRMFLVEVMGRECGYIAAYTAIAAGAEVAAIPETITNFPAIVQKLHEFQNQGKTSIIMIVSEGDEEGGAEILKARLEKAGCPYKMRVVVLGHLQRGGAPAPEDRRRATQMGHSAVMAIHEGKTGMMAGTMGEANVLVPFREAIATHRVIPDHLLELIDVVGR